VTAEHSTERWRALSHGWVGQITKGSQGPCDLAAKKCTDEESNCESQLICYGRLAVVSDVDGWGFALNVDKELGRSAVLYRSKYNGAMLGSRWT
jgi:hypothetical protein